MCYKSTNVNDLIDLLNERFVIFDVINDDNFIKQIKGTMCKDFLPEEIPDIIVFEKEVIDKLMKLKHISSLGDYAKENGLKFFRLEEGNYVFKPIKKESVSNSMIVYYDVEKDSYESFDSNNFIGIVE